MAKLKFLGVPVWMNGQNYYVPSLAWPDYKANYDLLTGSPTPGENTSEFMEKRIPVLLLAVQRNYPEVAQIEFETWVDMITFKQLADAAAGVSASSAVSEGE